MCFVPLLQNHRRTDLVFRKRMRILKEREPLHDKGMGE